MRATADLTAAPAEIAAILGIQAGRRALRRQETTADDEQTVIVTTLWFPPDVAAQAPKLADSRPLPAGSLGYIAAATGNQAARVDEESSAAAASLDDAAVLGVPDGSPVLRTRVGMRTPPPS